MKTCSEALAQICGAKQLATPQIVKGLWAYIKLHHLNQGLTIRPDAQLKKVFPVESLDMRQMGAYWKQHIQ